MSLTNLLANMMVLGMSHTIPTNPPAFQEYAFQAMFTNAAYIASGMNLNLATNAVTDFAAYPQPAGIKGFMIFSNRYIFKYFDGDFLGFQDQPNDPPDFLPNDTKTKNIVMKEWITKTNLLNLEKTQAIARSFLTSISLISAKTGLDKPIAAQQIEYEWQGENFRLPCYAFHWISNSVQISIKVSGVTTNIVSFWVSYPFLRIQTPTNYLEMLGLSTNTVFVTRRFVAPSRPQEYEIYRR